ncbi:MAG: hypothetical protein LC708_04375, partial [Actinobacteria bacterium]|nr:hypothetical protein [Actinomycetota bacterium]
ISSDGAGTTTVGEAFTYTITDPGVDTFPDVAASDRTIDCGSGGAMSAEAATLTGGSFTCTYSTTGSKIITVTAKDSDGAEGSDTESMTITSTGPSITWNGGNDYTVDEHATTERAFTFTATDLDGLSSTVTASCGTGGVLVTNSATINTSTGVGSFRCVFADGPATPTISVTVKDTLDNQTTSTQDVTVANVAPTVTITGDSAVNESSVTTHAYSFSITDPAGLTNDVASVSAHSCGTGGSEVTNSYSFNATNGTGTFTCTFPDGPASPSVSVNVSDGDSGTDSDAVAVTVANVAPTVAISSDGAGTTTVGEAFTYTITDPGVDTFPDVAASDRTIDCGS